MATSKKTTADQVKAAMAKVEAAKAAEAAKADAKAAEKKAPAKKTSAVKLTQTVYVQCCGYEVTTADIMEKVVDSVGKKTIKELNVYVKPEEGMVYYTADGEQGSVEL